MTILKEHWPERELNIINQMMVKDSHRDTKYSGTMKCACCGEESHLPIIFPFLLCDMIDHMEVFMEMHNIKGCNEVKVDTPEWASSKLSLALSN